MPAHSVVQWDTVLGHGNGTSVLNGFTVVLLNIIQAVSLYLHFIFFDVLWLLLMLKSVVPCEGREEGGN